MAITREDYKYVHNTFKRGSGRQDDGELKLGSSVKNLLTELSESNFVNDGYPEVYDTKEKTKSWYPEYEIKQYNDAFDVTLYWSSTGEYYYEKEYDGKANFSDVSGNYISKFNAYYDPSKNTTTLTIEFDGGMLEEDGLGDGETDSVTISVQAAYNTFKTNSEKTISTGLLCTQTTLESDTTYVLQVVDSIRNDSFGENEIVISSSNTTWKFGNYLFFRTPKTSGNNLYSLKIHGLSFGYSFLGKNENSQPIELRCFKSEEQAKVFLFKSTIPWLVNNQGVISGSLDDSLKYVFPEDSTKPMPLQMTENEAIKMFSWTAPQVKTLGNQILSVSVNEIVWRKNNAKWEVAYKDPNIKWTENFVLLIYRDSLVEGLKDWNNKKYKKRYGLIRTIQDETGDFSFSTQFPSIDEKASVLFTGIEGELTYSFDSSTQKSEVITLNLPLLAANLGHNLEYEKRKNLQIDNYTSIAFAWGQITPAGIVCLSSKTTPILINKNIFSREKTSDKYVIKQTNKYQITYKDTHEYYPSAYYIDL